MIINKPHLCTKLPIWAPKYSAKYQDEYGERIALLHKNKVIYGSPIIIIEFTRANHLLGQRFAILKRDAQKHKVGSNGTAPMYEIPMSQLESWESAAEINAIVNGLWPNEEF